MKSIVLVLMGMLLTGLSGAMLVARRSPNDSAWLAYTDKRDLDLHRVRRDGAQQVRLTSNRAYNYAPTWSPDGQTLVFSSNVEGDRDLYRINFDGGGMRQITGEGNDGQTEEDAQYSPDGRLVTVRLFPYWAGYPARFEIFVIRPDGTHAIALTRLSNKGVIVNSVTWSPDSTRLAVNAELPDHAGFAVYVVDADGQNLQLWARDWQIYDWTPDGRQLVGAVYQDVGDESPRLMMMAIDQPQSPQLLTDALPKIQYASLAPDGQALLVTSGCLPYELEMCLYRLPLKSRSGEGGQLQRLTGPHRWIPFAAWSARGGWIAWVGANGQERDLGLYLMRADGRDERRIVTDSVEMHVVWSPPMEAHWAGGLWLMVGAGILVVGGLHRPK